MSDEKILIVDDEKLVRWSLLQKCQEWGYQALEAEDGSDGAAHCPPRLAGFGSAGCPLARH